MSFVTKIDNIFKKGVIGNVRKAQEGFRRSGVHLGTPKTHIYPNSYKDSLRFVRSGTFQL